MTTIYEDIQALRARFRSEYGLEVRVDVRVFTLDNTKLPGYPARQTVDLSCKGGIPVEPVDHRGRKGGRWYKFDDWRNGVEIVLFR